MRCLEEEVRAVKQSVVELTKVVQAIEVGRI